MKARCNGVFPCSGHVFKTSVAIFDEHSCDSIRAAERRDRSAISAMKITEQILKLFGTGQLLQCNGVRIITQYCVSYCLQVLSVCAAVVFEFGIANVPRDQTQVGAIGRTRCQERALSRRIETNRGSNHQQAESSQ